MVGFFNATPDVFKIKKILKNAQKCFCENTQKLLTGNKQMQRQKTLGYKFSFSKKIIADIQRIS